jgi:hypothetical protein
MNTADHPLISLTEQEILNEAYYGIYRQLQEEYVDDAYRSDIEYYLDEAYLDNSPDPVLHIVSVGYKIPSEGLHPEEDNFWTLLNIDPAQVGDVRKHFLALLRLTDTVDTEDDPLEPLRQFAQDRGLTVPSDLD